MKNRTIRPGVECGRYSTRAKATAHAKRLQRRTGNSWKIGPRRNLKGRFSKRGDLWCYYEQISEQVYEWIINFTYTETGRSFDVDVTARDEAEAFLVAETFLKSDVHGRNIVNADFEGWDIGFNKGDPTTEDPGEAEYRSKSRATKKGRGR